ncbi:hypothetical protein EVAR_43598_1 [Eumeta japonica]|uniref:Uncharacterized protein n=1 Tax=Eumeta variegata TaxID=151549 RepID=A0A4C1XCP7_EUMVA|nr:hypothetical protein EVAR_43598_1 [Eumeta japonica]
MYSTEIKYFYEEVTYFYDTITAFVNRAQYVGAASVPQASYATNPERQAKELYGQQYQQQASTQTGAKAVYGQQYQHSSTQAGANTYSGERYPAQGSQPEPEPTGPPRGFFYSFDYPVSIIVPKNEAAAAERAHG